MKTELTLQNTKFIFSVFSKTATLPLELSIVSMPSPSFLLSLSIVVVGQTFLVTITKGSACYGLQVQFSLLLPLSYVGGRSDLKPAIGGMGIFGKL